MPSKIIHVKKGDALESVVESLCSHFEKFGSPVMMGGDVDCSSKGVVGVHSDGDNSELLIVVRKLIQFPFPSSPVPAK